MAGERRNSIDGIKHQQPRKAALDASMGSVEARPGSAAAGGGVD